MRRIDGDPPEPFDGVIRDKAICFGGVWYNVLSEEQPVPAELAEVFKACLVASIQHPSDVRTLCGWAPGIFITLYRINDDGQEVPAGCGAVCFHCEDWVFHFRSEVDVFGEHLTATTCNKVLSVARAVFPDDQVLHDLEEQKPREPGKMFGH